MGHSSSVLHECIKLGHLQMKKKLKSKWNMIALKLIKPMHLQIACARKKRQLLELFKLLFANRMPLRQNCRRQLKFRPAKACEKLQNRCTKCHKLKHVLKRLPQSQRKLQ